MLITPRLDSHMRLKRPPNVHLCDRNADFQVKVGGYGSYTVARLTSGPWAGLWAATRMDGRYWYDARGAIQSSLPHATVPLPEHYGEFPGDLLLDVCDGYGVRIEPILFATRNLRTTFSRLLHRCPGVDHGIHAIIDTAIGEEVVLV